MAQKLDTNHKRTMRNISLSNHEIDAIRQLTGETKLSPAIRKLYRMAHASGYDAAELPTPNRIGIEPKPIKTIDKYFTPPSERSPEDWQNIAAGKIDA